MRHKRLLMLGSLVALLLATESDSYGQRGGAAVGGARGGYASGPFGGAGGGTRTGGAVIGPGGGSASRGTAQGSYTTGRGTTIDYAGAGRKATGPGGVTAGRGAGGVQVTTPGGRTATKVGTAGGVSGPGGRTAVGGSSVGVGSGPRGTAVTGARGGAVIGPGGAAAGGTRVGVAAAPYGLSRYATTGKVAVGHRTTFVSAGAIRTQGVYVRRSFVHYNCFTPAWYRVHVNAWRPVAWTATGFWVGATWATLATTCAYPPQPVIYDYGTTIVYEDNRVYYNGEPLATAEEYTDQAVAIATKGQDAPVTEKDTWTALGVFGMVQGEEKDANKIFQLAINKDGILRGNYYDALSDTTTPVTGAVDRKTQRAAWTVGDRKETVYETGIGNLTEAETSMLVHFGKDRTQQWTLVRLDPPEKE